MKYFFCISSVIFVIAGCFLQEIYVYEKIPEKSECYRFKDYNDVKYCDLKHKIILNERLNKVINSTNH